MNHLYYPAPMPSRPTYQGNQPVDNNDALRRSPRTYHQPSQQSSSVDGFTNSSGLREAGRYSLSRATTQEDDEANSPSLQLDYIPPRRNWLMRFLRGRGKAVKKFHSKVVKICKEFGQDMEIWAEFEEMKEKARQRDGTLTDLERRRLERWLDAKYGCVRSYERPRCWCQQALW